MKRMVMAGMALIVGAVFATASMAYPPDNGVLMFDVGIGDEISVVPWVDLPNHFDVAAPAEQIIKFVPEQAGDEQNLRGGAVTDGLGGLVASLPTTSHPDRKSPGHKPQGVVPGVHIDVAVAKSLTG